MKYAGTELELFQHAVNWKRYWSALVKPYVAGDVLDVGSGHGANAPYLHNERVSSYTFLEPDGALLSRMPDVPPLPAFIEQRRIQGTTVDVATERFDTLLYIDVLEHIPDASNELQRAADLLRPNGHLILVVPAFQFLYSPFDKAIGHVCRYDRPLLRSQMPAAFEEVHMNYLDSAGMLLSLGNKLLLRSAEPTASQIALWDARIVPISRITDRLVGRALGRSLVAVYRKC